MMNKPEKPDESELLAFLDEELTPERQAEIRQLLAANWELRAQLARQEKRIEQYVEATAQQASIATPPVDDLWQDFSGRLSRTTAAPAASTRLGSGLQSFTAKLTAWWQRHQPGTLRLATGAVVSLLLLVAFVLLKTERPVSAHELLERTAQAEAASLRRVGDPVVYRKLQVKRSGAGEPVMWESWHGARGVSGGQFWQRVAAKDGPRFLSERDTPAIITELAQILRANHLDAQRPLSAAAYAEWRKTIRPQSESVVEIALPGKVAGLKLMTAVVPPVADHQIIAASFIIRRADWHAVAMRLNVRSENEIRSYELSETAYEVLPLEALTAFAELAPTPTLTPSLTPAITYPASPAAAPASVPTALPSTKPLPTEAELEEAEVAALYALHRVQADLGEQIEVVRAPNGLGGQVEVRGLVETTARKRQLAAALNHLPLVAVRLQSVEEVARQAAPPAPRATEIIPASEPAHQAAPGENAFEKKLAQYFAGLGESQQAIGAKIAELANTAIVETAAAKSEAWALRRLAERFSSEKERELSPAARRQMAEIMSHHITRLRLRVRHLQVRLEPALSAIGGEPVAAGTAALPTEPIWQTQALTVFKSVEQVHQLAGRLFASTGGGAELPEQAEQAAQQMLGAIARLDGALLKLEQQITR